MSISYRLLEVLALTVALSSIPLAFGAIVMFLSY